MSITDYIALSKLAYYDFNTDHKGASLDYIISKNLLSEKDLSSPELSALAGPDSKLRSWTLINYEPNTPSGFAGAAFQSPSGEIVFALRGTEADVVQKPGSFTLGDIVQKTRNGAENAMSGTCRLHSVYCYS